MQNNLPISGEDVFGGWVYRTIGGLTPEQQTEAKLALMGDLVEFQQKLTQPTKARDGYGYKYADLSDVLKAIQNAVKGLDIAYVQQPVSRGNQVGVHNYLLNGKGAIADWGSYLLEVNNAKPQSNGAALTYSRRYSISCIFGVASENDDDAKEFNSQPDFVAPNELQGLTVAYENRQTPIVDVYAKALNGDTLAKQILRDKDAKPATKDAVQSLDQIYRMTKDWRAPSKETVSDKAKSAEEKPIKEPKVKDPFEDKKVDVPSSKEVDDLFSDVMGDE